MINTFIFVAVVCINTKCDFIASYQTVTQEQCQVMKKQFLELPFKPEVTLAASQCMAFQNQKEIKL